MVSGILWLVEFLFSFYLIIFFFCPVSHHITCLLRILVIHLRHTHTQIIQQNPPLKLLSQVYEAFVVHDVTYWFHRFGPDAFERCHQASNR